MTLPGHKHTCKCLLGIRGEFTCIFPFYRTLLGNFQIMKRSFTENNLSQRSEYLKTSPQNICWLLPLLSPLCLQETFLSCSCFSAGRIKKCLEKQEIIQTCLLIAFALIFFQGFHCAAATLSWFPSVRRSSLLPDIEIGSICRAQGWVVIPELLAYSLAGGAGNTSCSPGKGREDLEHRQVFSISVSQ